MVTPVDATGRLFRVGVTGSMGCGKSTVSRYFARQGARIIDADQTARRVVEPGSPGWREVVATFGDSILQAPSSSDEAGGVRPLDRKKLAALVFSDPTKKNLLEEILHPKIEREHRQICLAWKNQLLAAEVAVVVMEIPLLFETGAEVEYDLTVTVFCGADRQWQRLSQRSNMSDRDKRGVIAAQLSEQEKIARADRTIDNSGTPAQTLKQVVELWREVVFLAKSGGFSVVG
ncbi:MAG: dephospho-CoA kinase [Magnetococcales bacterium]|nr:dephospho-CoA kinase [Magnetococcales bacterium]